MSSQKVHKNILYTNVTKKKKCLYSSCYISFLFFSLFSFSANAQEALQQETSQQKKIKDNSNVLLKEVVITSVPMTSPVMVVTDPKAPRQPVPATDGTDYLKTIPGFSAIRNGGTNGDPVFRGMFGSRLNIRSDGGVALGACPNRMDNPASYISPESYDRLTVIKGPQTVKWGPTGEAATVLFERDPQHFDHLTEKTNISTIFGSNERVGVNLDTTVGDKLGYARLIANKSRSGDYKDGDGNYVPSAWDKWNTDLFVGWTPNADTVLELSAGKGNGEARYAGRGMDGTEFKRESLGAKFITENVSDKVSKIEAQFYYNYADHVMNNFSLRELKPNAKKMEGEPDRRTMGGRIAVTWDLGDVALVTGIDAQTDTHRTKNRVNMLPTSGWNKDGTFDDYGLFSEMTWSFTNTQRLVAGGRVDWHSVEDFRSTSLTFGDKRHATLPSGFLRYEQDLSSLPITTYIGLGHAERYPDYWELFSPKLASKNAVNAFEGINPEKTTQIDFGAQYNTDKTNIWFSGYVGRIDDYILFDYTTGSSKARNINATILGGEAGISQDLTHGWRTDVSVAYAWGKNTTDDEALPQIPPLEGRIGLTYEYENWTIGGLARLVAKQTRIAKNMGNVVGKDFDESSAFAVFSVNGSYKFNSHIKLTAGIDNIFNKSYFEHLNRDGDAGWGFSSHYQLREPGRTFWAKADFKF